jgi:subfamily B ATP-binding cassette protein MsbA
MLSWPLMIFVLVLLPVSGLIIGRISRTLRRKSIKSQQMMGQLMSTIEETVSGLRIIKAFNAIDIADRKFKEMNQDYTKVMIGISRRGDLASPLSEFLGVIILVIILIYGGGMVLTNKIGLGAEGFIGFILIFSQLINPFKNLSTAWGQVQKGLASLDRINQVIDAEEIIIEKKDSKPIKVLQHSIVFRNVSFKYQDEFVLKDINLEIKKGERIAIVGISGSGKSTIADLIPRFHDCTAGEILIDGINIKEYSIHDLRALSGIVTQEPVLFNDTISNNIAFGFTEASETQIIEAAKTANAHDFIIATENGYQTFIGDRGSKLSGGQRQRISIARAILRKPEILIFDEATSSLDNESEKLVKEALEGLLKKHTSIMIAHRFSSIRHVDRIIVMHEGRIVESGTHAELIIINGHYKKLHDLQSLA